MAGEVTARTAEDVDQMVMTATQIKAIASGKSIDSRKGSSGNRTGEARTALHRLERRPVTTTAPADGITACTTGVSWARNRRPPEDPVFERVKNVTL